MRTTLGEFRLAATPEVGRRGGRRPSHRGLLGVLMLAIVGAVLVADAPSVSASPAILSTNGQVDFVHGSAVGSAGGNGTAYDAESKLFFTGDGIAEPVRWWAVLGTSGPTPAAGVWLFELVNHAWTARVKLPGADPWAKADALFEDGTLYVSTRDDKSTSGSNIRQSALYTLPYSGGGAWGSVQGPFAITTGTLETLTLARDSANRLWVTYESGGQIRVGFTSPGGTSFTFVTVSQTLVKGDDISSVAAFGGDRIGVFWSDQNAKKDYFAWRHDSAPVTAPWTIETAYGGGIGNCSSSSACADDHMNVKTSQGQVYVSIKSGLSNSNDPGTLVLRRSATGTWAAFPVTSVSQNVARPTLLLSPELDRMWVWGTRGSEVDVWESSLSAPSFTGSAFVPWTKGSGSSPADPTSTKQPPTAASGAVVVTSTSSGRQYWHNEFLPAGPPGPNQDPTFDQDLANRSDAEGAVISLSAHATDPESDPLTYAATGLPTGLAINTATGLITGTISAGAAASSPYSVSITVSDDGFTTVGATDTFTWTVTAAPPSGTITFRSASTGANNVGTSVVISTPAGVQTGDVMVAVLDVKAAPTVTTPGGWTLVSTTPNGSNFKQVVYTRVATGSEPVSTTWTINESRAISGVIVAYSGVSTTTPVEVFSAGTGTTASIAAPSVTSAFNGAMVIGAFGVNADATIAPPAGMTERGEIVSATRIRTEVADVVLASAGATGAKTATAAAAAANIGQLIVLRPASLPPPNTPPNAQDLTTTATAGAATSITLTGTDPETCQLTFDRPEATLGSGATVNGLANEPCSGTGPFQDTATVTYTAPAGFSGPDSFTYTVGDGTDGSNTATVSITVVAPPNTPPIAQDLTTTATAGVARTITLTGTDPETCELTFVRPDEMLGSGATVSGLANAACTGSGPFQDTATVTYTAPAGFSGPDSFTFTVHDGTDGSTTATVSIQVSPPNTPPNAQDLTTTATAGAATSITLTGTDPETCQLTFDRPEATLGSGATVNGLANEPCSGTGPFQDTATVTYTAPAGFSGPDSFTYTVGDGTDGSNTATVSITVVAPPNTPPIAQDLTTTATAGVARTITLTGTDPETCELTFVRPDEMLGSGATVSGLANAACTGSGPFQDTATVTYTAPAGFSGPDSFTFTVGDGTDTSATATVSIQVSSPPPPISFRAASTGANTIANNVTIAVPAGVQAGDVMVAVVDVKAAPTVTIPAGWNLVSNTVNGIRQLVAWRVATGSEPAAHTWTFNENRAASGAILAYSGVNLAAPVETFSAGGGATSSITAPSVTSAFDGARIIGAFGINADSTISPPVGMIERGEIVSATRLRTEVADLVMSSAGATGAKTATAAAAAANIGNLIALRPGGPASNLPPTAQDVTAMATAGVPRTITLTGTDPETCELTFVRSDATLGSGATVSGLANATCTDPDTDTATVTYTAPAGLTGLDSFTYTVHDGTGGSNVATVSITVYPPLVAPPSSSCLDPGRTIVTTPPGTQTSQYAPQPPDDATIDAAGTTWTPDLSTYPLVVDADSARLCWLDGQVTGSIPADMTWEQAHDLNQPCIRVIAIEWLVVDGLRCDNTGDGLRPRESSTGAQNVAMTLEDTYLTRIRDDCLENDGIIGGVVRDGLWDGCNTGISERPSQGQGAFPQPPGETLTLDRMMIGLEISLHERGPGENALFKWSSSANDLVIRCSIFKVNAVSINGTGVMDIPGVVDDSACPGQPTTLVWLGGGEYPGVIPAGMQVTADVNVWNAAAADWRCRHGIPAPGCE